MLKDTLPIPKIIHQIWLGPAAPPLEWMESWKKKNPSWDYKLWTEENIPKLYNQKQYDRITEYSGKADILRVEILYQYGGIYIDADCECLNPLDDWLRRYPFFVCYENELVRPGLIQNNVIGSMPQHEALEMLMEAISQIGDVNDDIPSRIVGPYLWTKVLRRYEIFNGFIDILPSHKFSPIHFEGACYLGDDKIYATHHWTTTTGGNSAKDFRFQYDSEVIRKQQEQEQKNSLENTSENE